MSDGDGTMHSIPTPLGIAVDTEEEAKRFVEDATKMKWWSPCYQKISIFKDKDEALSWYRKKLGL